VFASFPLNQSLLFGFAISKPCGLVRSDARAVARILTRKSERFGGGDYHTQDRSTKVLRIKLAVFPTKPRVYHKGLANSNHPLSRSWVAPLDMGPLCSVRGSWGQKTHLAATLRLRARLSKLPTAPGEAAQASREYHCKLEPPVTTLDSMGLHSHGKPFRSRPGLQRHSRPTSSAASARPRGT